MATFLRGRATTTRIRTRSCSASSPINPDDPGSLGYGLALAQFGPVYGHTGELPGYNTFVGYDPPRKIAIIAWSSLNAAPDGRAPAVEMAKVIIGHLYGGQVR